MQIKYTTMKASVILAAINNQKFHLIPAYVIMLLILIMCFMLFSALFTFTCKMN